MTRSPVASDGSVLEPKGLLCEQFPLLSQAERRAGERRPIVLIVMAAGKKEGEEDGVILAWPPGALKPGLKPPGDCRTLESFKAAMESLAIKGDFWLPQELGEAAAQLSTDPVFQALFKECHWSFGHVLLGVASAGQPWEPWGKELDGALVKAALLGWANARLSLFTLTVEEEFYEKMDKNQSSIEQRVIRALAVQKEALQLERAVKKVKAGAGSSAPRRAGL